MEINIRLIDLCISNDREAQNQLYRILLPYLNAICQRYLHDQAGLSDVLQETFIRIFRNMEQFDVQKASFKTWTTKIAINCCRKQNAKSRQTNTQELIIPLHETLINPQILKKLSNEELLRWLKKMPRQYFEVFNLYLIEGFSHQEVGELLGIDESLSRQRLTRARSWLKKKLPAEMRPDVKVSKR